MNPLPHHVMPAVQPKQNVPSFGVSYTCIVDASLALKAKF